MRYRTLLGAALLSGGVLPWSTPAPAQGAHRGSPGAEEVFAGSEWEEYLRFLQSLGGTRAYPWSVRAFSPREADRLLPRDTVHPWRARGLAPADTAAALEVRWIEPRAQLIYNSAFPYGANDGPVWAGKGLTTVLQGGVAVRYGPVSLVVAPVVFRAENQSFPLAGDTVTGDERFRDPMGVGIDLPQRFGDGAYTRIDPGQSTLRIDLASVTAGVSTANQFWGPATAHPLLLGNNAAGFPHVFLGTGRPVGIGIGTLHGRLLLGSLSESDYSFTPDSLSRRVMSGVVAVFSPRGLPTLELGGARLVQSRRFDGAVEQHLRDLFGGLLKSGTGDPNDQGANAAADQRASLFLRWLAPRSGFELYAEYGREDHSWNLRDFLLEPDHSSGYMVGVRKAWPLAESRFVTLRGEVLNTQSSHLRRVRNQGIFYVGSGVPQGHTHHGQILGAAAGFGGSGLVLGSDFYHPGGRWSIAWTRSYAHGPGNDIAPLEPDVLNSIGVNALFFRGRWDLTAGVDGVYRRDPYRAAEEWNLRSVLQLRARL